MKALRTLDIYFTRQFLFWIVASFVAILLTIFIADTIEQLRRAASRGEAQYDLELLMVFYRLPQLGQILAPFAFMIGAVLSFLKLAKTQEFLVARACGVSIYRFMLWPAVVTLVLSGLLITVYNPMAAKFYQKLQVLETSYAEPDKAKPNTNIWLKQSHPEGYMYIYAKQLDETKGVLEDASFYVYSPQDGLLERLDAATAELQEGEWLLQSVKKSKRHVASQQLSEARLPTTLTKEGVRVSVLPKEALSFWELPHLVSILEEQGFSSKRYVVAYHNLLALPVMIIGFVLLVAGFCLRASHRLIDIAPIVFVFTVTFSLFIFRDISVAMAQVGRIPDFLGPWAPAAASLLFGLASVVHFEDT